jgi:hypothetical protein
VVGAFSRARPAAGTAIDEYRSAFIASMFILSVPLRRPVGAVEATD